MGLRGFDNLDRPYSYVTLYIKNTSQFFPIVNLNLIKFLTILGMIVETL